MNGGRTDRTDRQRKERFHLKDASWISTAAATDITSKPSLQSQPKDLHVCDHPHPPRSLARGKR